MTLTDKDWDVTHAIATTLAKADTDVNELGKVIAYLRSIINQNRNDGVSRFFKYLKTLVTNGRQIGHSGRTLDYYRSIDQACSAYLKGYQGDAETLLEILGWSARLMRYYKVEPIGEIPSATVSVSESSRQREITKVAQSQNFQVDQVLEAKVTKVSGNKVTYEILATSQLLSPKEPKKASSLQESQMVKVKIVALKEDGSIKSVKCVE